MNNMLFYPNSLLNNIQNGFKAIFEQKGVLNYNMKSVIIKQFQFY